MAECIKFTTQNINYSTDPDCVLSPDDPIHELLGTKVREFPKIDIGINKARIQQEMNIKLGTQEWFKLWFSKPDLTGERPYED